MRYLKVVLLTAIFAMIAVVASAEDFDFAEMEYGYPETLYGMQQGDEVEFSARTKLKSSEIPFLTATSTFVVGPLTQGINTSFTGDTTSASHVFTMTESVLSACIDGNGELSVTIIIVAFITDTGEILHRLDETIACSISVTPNLNGIHQEAVCGTDNDLVAIDPALQPPGISITSDASWNNGSWNVTFSSSSDHASLTTADPYVHTLYDSGPCTAEAPVSPIQSEVCGFEKDEITLQNQPTGVNPVPNDTGWHEGERTITYLPAVDYIFPENTTTAFKFTDSGPCMVEPNPPTQSLVCGVDNDLVTIPKQPAGVLVSSDDQWSNGERRVSFSVFADYAFPDETVTKYTFTDSGPCVTDLPIPPVVTEVCGPDNDVVQLDANQPANVNVATDGEWTDGKWTITFSAAENYVLPQEATAVYNLVDEATPCPTDAPVSPVQSAVCGPNNDLLTFPDQPEGITLASDSDWEENERTVTFAISDEFVTDGPTSFTFKDANEACPVIPVGKTVTVKLETSDGGSIEDAPYVLDASVASQAAQPAYDNGVVGANNTIVFENLIAGQYRLTVNAEGYEPVDEMLVVSDDGMPMEHTIQVTALQVPVTPTPEPTAAPTAAPVSALPSTGTGSGGGSMLAGMALMIAATIMAAGMYVGRRQRIPLR